jgi:hypothetical protein
MINVIGINKGFCYRWRKLFSHEIWGFIRIVTLKRPAALAQAFEQNK